MGDDYDYEPDYEEAEPERPRDRKIDEAKAVLMEEYFSKGTNVYYARQLEIWQEKQFFHWITARALREFAEERQISFSVNMSGTHKTHFYYPFRHRYPRRQITQTLKLITEFSDPTFTRVLGRHGEMLVESGLARTGFRISATQGEGGRRAGLEENQPRPRFSHCCATASGTASR